MSEKMPRKKKHSTKTTPVLNFGWIFCDWNCDGKAQLLSIDNSVTISWQIYLSYNNSIIDEQEAHWKSSFAWEKIVNFVSLTTRVECIFSESDSMQISYLECIFEKFQIVYAKSVKWAQNTLPKCFFSSASSSLSQINGWRCWKNGQHKLKLNISLGVWFPFEYCKY